MTAGRPIRHYWHVYTDGSSDGQHGGWAFVRVSPEGYRIERSGAIRRRHGCGSERAEIMAVVAALASMPVPGRHVVVHTDCEAVIYWAAKVLRSGPMPKTLRDSWLHRRFKEFLQRHAVQFVKRGRGDCPDLHEENYAAHKLARAAIGITRRRSKRKKFGVRRFASNRWPPGDLKTRTI